METLLKAEKITKSYGEKTLFTDISLSVAKNDKTALVARNGAGKTTLLNILSEADTPDSGAVTSKGGLITGYLQQEPVLNDNETVIGQVFASSGEIAETVRKYYQAVRSGDKSHINEMSLRMDALQAWDSESKAKQILDKLDLKEFNKPVSLLSGGQKKRLALAKVLLEDPQILIMDEPTNHLDTEMTEWLENYLTRPGMTIIMVTHDRYFLDRICNKIMEIDNGNLFEYDGNYSAFLQKRSERLQQNQAETEKARNLLRKELDWIRRTPKARTGKSKSRISSFHELKDKSAGKDNTGNISIRSGSKRLGSKILEIKNLNKSFGQNNVISNFSYTFSRFEKIGVTGKNGTGKSTFLNLITSSLEPGSGIIKTGETVQFGYFRQEGISFNDGEKVLDAARRIADTVKMSDGSVLTVSQFLNHFLFPPARQNDYIGKLSGGEKRRLFLVTVLMQNPNFLILDEPTNDLDIDTLNILEDYLSQAKICLLVVSHDRFFIDKVANQLFVFEGDGLIKVFPGNYSQYRDFLRHSKTAEKKPVGSERKPETKKVEKNRKQKLSYKEKRELEQLEKEIDLLEAEMSEVKEALSGGKLSAEELQKKSKRFAEIEKELDEKTDRWVELSEKESG